MARVRVRLTIDTSFDCRGLPLSWFRKAVGRGIEYQIKGECGMSTANLVFNILERIREDKSTDPLARQLASWAENVQWFDKYADGRDAPKGIVAANWNKLDRYDSETKSRKVSDVPQRFERLFEAYG